MDATKITLLVIVGAVVLVLYGRLESRRRKARIEAVFAGRERLTPEQFYERYFQEKGVPFSIVSGVRKILEEQLGADLACMSAEDDFSRNLQFFWAFDDMADVAIVEALESHFDVSITDAEAAGTHTVKDIISLIHSKGPGGDAAPVSDFKEI
jgi:acyl carrier protein